MKKRVKLIVNFAGMIVLASATVIGNVVCNIFESQINSFLCPPISNNTNNSTETASGEDLVKEICDGRFSIS